MNNHKLNLIEQHLKSQLAFIEWVRLSQNSNPRRLLFAELLHNEISQHKQLYYHFSNTINPLDYAIFKDTDKPCIYLINDFYIGKTVNLKKRITSHLVEAALSVTVKNKICNLEKSHKIITALNKGKLKVKILSYDTTTEREFICSYLDKGYNLANKMLRTKL